MLCSNSRRSHVESVGKAFSVRGYDVSTRVIAGIGRCMQLESVCQQSARANSGHGDLASGPVTNWL